MTNHESLDGKDSVYLGLSGVSEEFKNTGLASLVYLKFIQEALNFQKDKVDKLILYATTATPSAYNSINKLWKNLNPKLDGTFDKKSEVFAKKFASKYGLLTNNHPFVLKGAAQGTQYSQSETDRINRIIEKYNFTLFHELGIRESEGDRLLMFFELPTAIEFKNYRQQCI